jgi:hypothetical protein
MHSIHGPSGAIGAYGFIRYFRMLGRIFKMALSMPFRWNSLRRWNQNDSQSYRTRVPKCNRHITIRQGGKCLHASAFLTYAIL